MDKRDYYEVLGLQKGASDEEIKRAFRKLAKVTLSLFLYRYKMFDKNICVL